MAIFNSYVKLPGGMITVFRFQYFDDLHLASGDDWGEEWDDNSWGEGWSEGSRGWETYP